MDGENDGRVITVRLPAELHQKLKDLAHERKISMNELCVRALDELVDAEKE